MSGTNSALLSDVGFASVASLPPLSNGLTTQGYAVPAS